MKFLIDENIRKEVIDFIVSLGYDVLIVPSGCADQEVAKIAKEEKRIILTHDIHFANILEYPPQEFSGIIRIRIHPPIAPTIIGALNNLFEKLSPAQIDKKLIILEKDGFRIR
jgi:predicted nuclease of predicted toxin-antitoxin system